MSGKLFIQIVILIIITAVVMVAAKYVAKCYIYGSRGICPTRTLQAK